LPANLDDARFLQAIFMMADGFFCRRAVDPNFDAAAGADTLFAAMRGLAQVLLLPEPDDGPAMIERFIAMTKRRFRCKKVRPMLRLLSVSRSAFALGSPALRAAGPDAAGPAARLAPAHPSR
jgi:hypothetical protein